MLDLVDDDTIEHYSLLVISTFLLRKKEINKEDIHDSRGMLADFVNIHESCHGRAAIRFNFHLLVHAPTSVEKTGPLWSTSAYSFESNIRRRKK